MPAWKWYILPVVESHKDAGFGTAVEPQLPMVDSFDSVYTHYRAFCEHTFDSYMFLSNVISPSNAVYCIEYSLHGTCTSINDYLSKPSLSLLFGVCVHLGIIGHLLVFFAGAHSIQTYRVQRS